MYNQPITEDTKLTLTIGQLKRLLKETFEEIDITDKFVELLENIRNLTEKTDGNWHSVGSSVASEINTECRAALQLIGNPRIKNPGVEIIDAFKRIQAMTDKIVFDSWLPIPGEIVKEINEVCEHTLLKIKGI